MHDAFYALAAHEDIAKLELEDGLLRHAAVELLSKRSSIRQIVVDLTRARSIDLGVPARPADFDASVRITADSEEDAHPDALADLVLDVASIVGTWTVANHETTELPGVDWHSHTWREAHVPLQPCSWHRYHELRHLAPGCDRKL